MLDAGKTTTVVSPQPNAFDRGGSRQRRAEPVLSWIFLAVVGVCLIAPLLQTLYPIFPRLAAPLEERRQPGAFPPLPLLLAANGTFATQLNRWFDDRVGFRDLFIRSKNQVDYSLFRTSRKVFVGADGWLFGKDNNTLPLERLDSAGLAALENRFVAFAQRLKEKNIRLIVVAYPDKSKIYPEMAPPEVPLFPPGGNGDRLRRFLAEQKSLIFIDAEAILQGEKAHNPDRLYLKHDMHVTIPAQVPIVKEIVAQIAAAEGHPYLRWNRNLTLRHTVSHGGGEANQLAVLLSVPETYHPFYVEDESVGGKSPDGTWNVPDPHGFATADGGVGRAFDFEFRSRPELCPQRLPGTVLFGNSFSDLYWMLGLQHYFCFIRRIREPMSRFKLFYDTMPEGTGYFIFQLWMPWLPGDAPPLEDISGKGAG